MADGEMTRARLPSWTIFRSFKALATGRRWQFFFAWPVITNGGNWTSRYWQEIEASGRQLPVATYVLSPAMFAQMVSGTRLVATVPERLGERIGGGQAIVLGPSPESFKIGLVWTAPTHASPIHQWMRRMIGETVRAATRS